MSYYEQIYCFQNLYRAHANARKGKRNTKEVIEFEMNLSENLARLSTDLREHRYTIIGYYSFMVYDPKKREIHALHYRDRVVQHCLCDEVLGPVLEKRLIFDNAACRIGKGNHFAINRTSNFLRKYYAQHGVKGYILKCDIRKYFDNINHSILKKKLNRVFQENEILGFLGDIIDSYETTSGKGLPLGNQTSQWFALYYLDGFDRLIKEKMGIKYYSRYMDDCILIHESKEYLQTCRKELECYLKTELGLQFNEKTQVFPISAGVDFLGFHLYLTNSGKVIRKVRQQAKYKYKRKLKYMKRAYEKGEMELSDIQQVLTSYHAHLSHGHTYRLERLALKKFVLHR